MAVRRARWQSRLTGDEGFSIIESTVALVLIFGVTLAVLGSMDSAIRVLVETRRQAAASALANELLERARSLEWENTGLTAASNDADCPGDPPADGVDGVGCADWSTELGVAVDGDGDYTFEGEKIIFVNEDQTFDPFLSFHQELLRDDTTFDRFLFVTRIEDGSGNEQWRKLTAVVQWVPPSGFRKEIRQVTYVARFREPSQPFLKGSIVFDGGSVSVSGRAAGTLGFLDPAKERPDLVAADFEFPDAQMDATTDYVSGASVVARGMVGDVRWADGFSSLDVATLASTGAEEFERRADDDHGSGAPLDDPNDGPKDFDWWFVSNPVPHDLLADEEDDARLAADTARVEGEAWTEYNPGNDDPKIDGLPYARLVNNGMESAEAALGGFIEYACCDSAGNPDDNVDDARELYEAEGFTLAESQYLFFLFYQGAESGPFLRYTGTVDRFETALDKRRVDVGFDWDGGRVFLLGDTAYDAVLGTSINFLGWLRIDLPLASGTLQAGEATAVPAWNASGDLEIAYFDPGSSAYVTLFDQDYAGLVNGAPQTVDVDSIPGNGAVDAPLSHPLTDLGRPQITYEVSALLTVNPPTTSVATDSNGDRAEVVMQAPSIVTGTLTYRVVDNVANQVLYDMEIDVNLGGVEATTRYINPEAN